MTGRAIRSLAHLPGLRWLDLGYVRLRPEDLEPLGNCRTLEALNLGPWIGGPAGKWMQYLRACGLRALGVGHFSGLRLEPEAIQLAASIPSLEQLYVTMPAPPDRFGRPFAWADALQHADRQLEKRNSLYTEWPLANLGVAAPEFLRLPPADELTEHRQQLVEAAMREVDYLDALQKLKEMRPDIQVLNGDEFHYVGYPPRRES